MDARGAKVCAALVEVAAKVVEGRDLAHCVKAADWDRGLIASASVSFSRTPEMRTLIPCTETMWLILEAAFVPISVSSLLGVSDNSHDNPQHRCLCLIASYA